MSKEIKIFQPVEQKEIPKILRIGVDIDGTILEIDTWIYRTIKRGLKVDLRKIPLAYHIENLPEITVIPNGRHFVEKIFEETYIYEKARPIASAIETIQKWKNKGHQLWFITARPKTLREITSDWFNQHGLSWAIEQIIYMDDFSIDRALYKNEVAKRLGLEVLIDDHAETLKTADAITLRIKIGLKYPWNQNEDIGQNSILVASWEEIDRIVSGIK